LKLEEATAAAAADGGFVFIWNVRLAELAEGARVILDHRQQASRQAGREGTTTTITTETCSRTLRNTLPAFQGLCTSSRVTRKRVLASLTTHISLSIYLHFVCLLFLLLAAAAADDVC